MNSELNDDNSINYVCVYHDYCQLLPISTIEKHTMSIISIKIITIIMIIE